MKTKLLTFVFILFINTIFAQNKNDNQLPSDWIDCAIKVTGTFETSSLDWGSVTPNFDGQGISCGLIQLNIGQQSFQPFFLKFNNDTISKYMPLYGKKMIEICKLEKNNALNEINKFHKKIKTSGGKDLITFNDEGKILSKELSFLLKSEEGISNQKEIIIKKANNVWSYTKKWSTDMRGENAIPTLTEFLVFYDNNIFNGSMKVDKNGKSNDGAEYLLEYKDVIDFKKKFKNIKSINDSICNWLSKPEDYYDQKKEAIQNSLLWRNALDESNVDLFIISYLRALYSNGSNPKGRFKANVLSRRGTIILNNGYVNGSKKLKTFDCLLNDNYNNKLQNEFLNSLFSEIHKISNIDIDENDCNINNVLFVEGKKENKFYRTLVYKKDNKYFYSDDFVKYCINKMPFVSSEFDNKATVENHNRDYFLLKIAYIKSEYDTNSYFAIKLNDNKNDPAKEIITLMSNSEFTNNIYKFPTEKDCAK